MEFRIFYFTAKNYYYYFSITIHNQIKWWILYNLRKKKEQKAIYHFIHETTILTIKMYYRKIIIQTFKNVPHLLRYYNKISTRIKVFFFLVVMYFARFLFLAASEALKIGWGKQYFLPKNFSFFVETIFFSQIDTYRDVWRIKNKT